ncbi:MAG TPA: hypothetical protein VLJ15_08590 [Gammaproteobacteria bacterium]|nr:hypothetical protein [Gammaproteobacteria bacterium]
MNSRLSFNCFNWIVNAAMAQDPEQLIEPLEMVCINVWNEAESGSPVTVLAKRGEVGAVNFLLKPPYNASPAHAACGYGQAGDLENFSDLLKEVAKKSPLKVRSVIQAAAYGFALHQNPEKLAAFLKKIEKEYPDEIPHIQADLAKGHAQRGNINAARDILTRAEKKYPIDPIERMIKIEEAIAEGLALSANVEGIKNFFPDEGKLHQKIIARCLARVGCALRMTGFKWYQEGTLFEEFSHGTCQSGEDKVYGSAGSKAFGFAYGGHKAGAYRYQGAFHDIEIAAGFAAGGHIDAAYDYFISQPSHRHENFCLQIARHLVENNDLDGANAFLEKLKSRADPGAKNVSLMVAALVHYFFLYDNIHATWYFFEKAPPDKMIPLLIGCRYRPYSKNWAFLQDLLERHPGLTFIFLNNMLSYANNDKVSIDTLSRDREYDPLLLKALLTISLFSSDDADSGNIIDPALEASLTGLGFDVEQLENQLVEAAREAIRLGFTLPQWIMWNEPDIQGMLLLEKFPQQITMNAIGIVVEYLSIHASQGEAYNLAKYAATRRLRLFQPALQEETKQENPAVVFHVAKPPGKTG